MRFVIDESVGPAVASWLRAQGHDVVSVYDTMRGSTDEQVIRSAFQEGRILVTNDKDFGALIFRGVYSHSGVILLRLEDNRTAAKIAALSKLLDSYSERIEGGFAVVTDKAIRFSRR